MRLRRSASWARTGPPPTPWMFASAVVGIEIGSAAPSAGNASVPDDQGAFDHRGDVAFNAWDTSTRWEGALPAWREYVDGADPRQPPERGVATSRRGRGVAPRTQRCTPSRHFGLAGVAFHVQDPGEGDSARGLFTGQARAGVVRPLLEWTHDRGTLPVSAAARLSVELVERSRGTGSSAP